MYDGWCAADLGTADYTRVLGIQHRLAESIISGQSPFSGVVLLVEHSPVFTLGQRGGRENLKVSAEFLEESEIPVIQAERGGNITYHGPGQLVVYPVADLKKAGLSVAGYVEGLEEVMIRTAAGWKITASRNPAGRGVWVGDAKLGSIGIRVRKSVAFHGFALNVSVSMLPFEWINPCGIVGVRMTSMVKETGQNISMSEVCHKVVEHLQDVFGKTIKTVDRKYFV